MMAWQKLQLVNQTKMELLNLSSENPSTLVPWAEKLNLNAIFTNRETTLLKLTVSNLKITKRMPISQGIRYPCDECDLATQIIVFKKEERVFNIIVTMRSSYSITGRHLKFTAARGDQIFRVMGM